METPSIFDNISPLDHRYYTSNKKLFDRLRAFLSETAAVHYTMNAELALLKTHVHFHLADDKTLIEGIKAAGEQLHANEVYEEEEKTQHNVRALVNVLQRYLPDRLKPFVHLGATSVDILDTAFSMRVRDAVRKVILPLLIDLELRLVDTVEKEAGTPEVGRTHGQHAVPVTFGFAIAEYAARLGKSIEEIEVRSNNLRGKLSGAVGAYNATSMITADPVAFERYYLDSLGLEPSEISTQMVEPEYMLRLLTELQIAFGIIANLADDLRHLQRSEIDEVREFFSAGQVGSSTMPQKRNPWNSEHVKSLWKAFSPRVLTFYMDQISEHQRDLTNSASSRFVAEYLAGFAAASERMRKIIERLAVHSERMLELVREGRGSVLAEPAYILLALSGDAEAHEKVRRITLDMEKSEKTFYQALRDQKETWTAIYRELSARTGLDAEEFFAHPENYRGLAREKAEEIGLRYRNSMNRIKEQLQ